jgi:DNA polymerase-4
VASTTDRSTHRIRKSIGAEATFFRDLIEFDDMQAELQPILDKVWRWCESSGVRGRTVTLKVKYADFRQITRSRSLPHGIQSRALLERVSLDLLSPLTPPEQGVRLLGVTLSALNTAEVGRAPQLSLAL